MSSKSRIESVAFATVQKSGLKSLSFRTLGAEVGVKSSSVHYHFPEKSDLGEALINRYRDDLLKSIELRSEKNTTAYASIKHFCHDFTELSCNGRICFAGMMAAEVESLSQTNRENLNKLFVEIHTWLLAEFERAADELVVDLPAATLANVLFASLQGALLIDRAQSSGGHITAVNRLIDSWFGQRQH